MIAFHEQFTGVTAVRFTPVFAELNLPSSALAIAQTQPVSTQPRGIIASG